MGRCWGQSLSCKINKFRDLMYSMVVSLTILYCGLESHQAGPSSVCSPQKEDRSEVIRELA